MSKYIIWGIVCILIILLWIKFKIRIYFGYDEEIYYHVSMPFKIQRTAKRAGKKIYHYRPSVLKHFISAITIEKLIIKIGLTTDDVILYGVASIIYGILISTLKNMSNVKNDDIKFISSKEKTLEGECILSARFGNIIYVTIKNMPAIYKALRKGG